MTEFAMFSIIIERKIMILFRILNNGNENSSLNVDHNFVYQLTSSYIVYLVCFYSEAEMIGMYCFPGCHLFRIGM